MTKGTQKTSSNWSQRNGDRETVQQRIEDSCSKNVQRATKEHRLNTFMKLGKQYKNKMRSLTKRKHFLKETNRKFGAEVCNDFTEEFNRELCQ